MFDAQFFFRCRCLERKVLSLKARKFRFYVKQDIDACIKKIACMNIQMGLNGCSHSISARNFRVAVHFERYMQRAEREREHKRWNVWKRLPSTKSKIEPKSDKTRGEKIWKIDWVFCQSVLISTTTTTTAVHGMHSIKLILFGGILLPSSSEYEGFAQKSIVLSLSVRIDFTMNPIILFSFWI